MKVSDEALLAGMASGDIEAAAAFVRRFQARVYGLAITVVGIAEDAEEVAQEAFVRAWRYAGSFDPRSGKVSTWLLTITRNVAIDTLRVRRDLPVDPAAVAEVLVASVNDVDRHADSDHIVTALRSIPREQAVAVVLAVHFGFTAREISECQGIPLGTAKSRIRHGLAKLRSTLEESRGQPG